MEFDPGLGDRLGMPGATAEEMAAWFGVSARTMERRMGKKDREFCRS